MHGRGRPRIERAADEIVELGSDRVDVEAGELEPLRVWLPDETDEDVVGRPGRDRGHPAGREYEDPRPGQLPDQVTQEQQITSRTCAAVTAVGSWSGPRRTASSSAVHELRPVSSAATTEYGQPGIICAWPRPRP